MNNSTLNSFTNELVRVTGVGTVLTMNDISISNTDLLSKPGIYLDGFYSQTILAGAVIDSVSTDTDGSIFKFDLATILQISQFSFSNINSSTSDSTNNYMILIGAMDLTAAFPSMLQNVTVNNATTGLLHVQTVSGSLSDANMLMIQQVTISDCHVESSIDMIALTTLSTYDSYAIIFSSIIFNNLEFVQGGNIFNFEHLLGTPVQIIDSQFNNIVGGKINAESFTQTVANLSTNLVISNVTVDSVNAQYGSFMTLQTGAVVSISESSFTNIN